MNESVSPVIPNSGWCAPHLTTAMERIDHFVLQRMTVRGTPGLALAITGRAEPLAVRNYGFADLAARSPVREETLFAFASIGKVFTAVCLLQLAAEGVIDLQAPVSHYLPWFAVQSGHAPITIHHLLTHTAGIIHGGDFGPDSPYQVWVLRETAVSGPPGERFYYSNVGYKALGYLLEAVTGKSYGEIVEERILTPLEMAPAASVITHALRKRLAVAYTPFYDDRPYRREHGVVPATWVETHTGDGSLASSASALATFLRMLLNRGRSPHGTLLTEESYTLLLGPHAEMAPGEGYGYGLETKEIAGQQALGHQGDLIGYESSMYGLVAPGIGAVAMINGPGDAHAVVEFALGVVDAALAGRELPDPPRAGAVVANVADYAGTYRRGAATLEVVAADDRLTLVVGDTRAGLEPRDDDAFLVDHPDFALFPLRFGRDASGTVIEAVHGSNWYPGDRYAGVDTFVAPAAWNAFPGHYRSHNPWFPNYRIVLRKGRLWVIWPSGDEDVLMPDGTSFRVSEDEHSPERITFDTVVNGAALRARWAGGDDYAYRFFTP